MTKKHKETRFSWCKERLNWSAEKWGTVLFSDESSFQLFSNRVKRVRCRTDEKYNDDCVAAKVQKGGASVMIWGCLSAKGIGELHFVEGTVDSVKYTNILDNYMLPSKKKLYGRKKNWLFQQDNARPHTSAHTTTWFVEHKIPLLSWPPNSPDLNIIENAWNQMKKEVEKKIIRNKNELMLAIAQAWSNLGKDYCQKLSNSMVKRVKDCYEAKGGRIKY